MFTTKALSEGTKLIRKMYDSIDDKATNIPGRKTSSISVGTERQKRSKTKQKSTEAIAAGAIVEALGIPSQTVKQEKTGSDSMGKTMPTRRKDTVRDIKGTPAEIAADKKRAKAVKVPKPKRKPKVPTSTKKSSNPEVYVDSSVTYDMNNMPKKMSGGKVNYRKFGGKVGRGCGAALRGGGKVMR